MTRKEFLELGNYITCLSNRTTIYNGRRLKIENSIFKYVYLLGNKCCIKSIKDENNKIRIFSNLKDVKEYIQSYPVEGMKRI
jgi:hypothetical protein